MHVKALEAMVKNDALPCNIKFMIEGEEEVGSKNLASTFGRTGRKLKADVVLISDTAMTPTTCPASTPDCADSATWRWR